MASRVFFFFALHSAYRVSCFSDLKQKGFSFRLLYELEANFPIWFFFFLILLSG